VRACNLPWRCISLATGRARSPGYPENVRHRLGASPRGCDPFVIAAHPPSRQPTDDLAARSAPPRSVVIGTTQLTYVSQLWYRLTNPAAVFRRSLVGDARHADRSTTVTGQAPATTLSIPLDRSTPRDLASNCNTFPRGASLGAAISLASLNANDEEDDDVYRGQEITFGGSRNLGIETRTNQTWGPAAATRSRRTTNRTGSSIPSRRSRRR